MESPVYQEWIKEERAEAEAKKAREVICRYLSRRFGETTKELQEKVKGENDLEVLDSVMEELFAAETLEEVAKIINSRIGKQA